jgi:type IV pilus assembly protein PilB
VSVHRLAHRGKVAARKRLGELLVEAGVIDDGQLQAVLAHQRRWGGKLGQCLVGLRLASEAQVVRALSSKLDCAVVDLAALEPGPDLEAALKLIPGDLALRHKLLPIAVDRGSLTVAMADPTNVVVVDELAFRAGRRIRIVIAGEHEVVQAVRRLYFLEPVEPVEDLDLPAPPPRPRAPPGELELDDPAPPPLQLEPARDTDLTPRQAAVLDALGEAGRGQGAPAFEPTRLAAAVARLLVIKGVISDLDLLAELAPRQ